MHFSLPKMCTLVLAKSFALLLAKTFAPQFFPSWMALSSHFPLPKTLHFSKQFAFFALSHGVTDRRSKQQSERSNFRLHRSSLSSKKSKKWIKLIPKTIGNRKRDCAWGCAWGINTTWENLQIEKHKSVRRTLTELICAFRSADFLRWCLFPKRNLPHAQSLFLFPIVFGINCYYYLRVLYFANICDLEKIAKLSTRKNFYQHIRCIYNHKLPDDFPFWIRHNLSLLIISAFPFFLPVPSRAQKSDVW